MCQHSTTLPSSFEKVTVKNPLNVTEQFEWKPSVSYSYNDYNRENFKDESGTTNNESMV